MNNDNKSDNLNSSNVISNDNETIENLNEVNLDKEKELTDEEKKASFIEALKNSKKFTTKKHFGREYKKNRKLKNKSTKKSRKINRK